MKLKLVDCNYVKKDSTHHIYFILKRGNAKITLSQKQLDVLFPKILEVASDKSYQLEVEVRL